MGSKRADDPSFLSLYIDAQIHSHVPRRNPGDWALEISGSILVSEKTKARFGSHPETEIGTPRAFLIPTQEARQEGFDACAVLNAKSFATSEYTPLFKNAEWRKRVTKKFHPRSTDLLILDRIELKPEYRGQGFGLLAIRCMIGMFGWPCGLVACKPYPLQFERSNRWELPAQVSRRADGLRKARKKLRQYWAQVGFERVPGTMLYALNPRRGRVSRLGRCAVWRDASSAVGGATLLLGHSGRERS